MGNVQIAAWRICILMLGYEGYKEIKRRKRLEKRENESCYFRENFLKKRLMRPMSVQLQQISKAVTLNSRR